MNDKMDGWMDGLDRIGLDIQYVHHLLMMASSRMIPESLLFLSLEQFRISCNSFQTEMRQSEMGYLSRGLPSLLLSTEVEEKGDH